MDTKIQNENIEVPITNEEIIVVSTQELPSSSELLSLLPSTVDLKFWLRFAIAYYKQNRIEDFKAILLAALPSTNYDRKQTKQALLSVLSFYSLNQLHSSSLSNNNEEKKRLLEEAQMRLFEAEKIDSHYQILWIVRGVLFLEKGNYEKAEIQFQTVLSRWKENVPSLCGMALSFTRRNEWKKALRFWQLALRIISLDPKYPNSVQCDVRLGIGACFGRLGMMREAELAFLRVLSLDPKHATALVLLSSIAMNIVRKSTISFKDRREHLLLVSQYVEKAFEAMKERNECNPIVLTRLSDFLFLRKEYSKSFKILQDIPKSNVNDPTLLAEIHYYVGRHHHVLKEYDLAQSEYARSLSFVPDFLLSKYALGQILISRSQFSHAIEYFEFIRSKLRQDNYDILKMLAFLHAQLAESPIQTSSSIPTKEYEEGRETCRQLYARAMELFKTLLEFQSHDPEEHGMSDTEILLMYARILESSPLATSDTRARALKLYSRAKEILIRTKKRVPDELLNNLGVLYHVADDFKVASQLFVQALKGIQGNDQLSSEDKDALETTLLYNLGRCYEELRNDAEAERFYNAVLKKQPLYYDSMLRLGLMEQAKGQLEEAASYFTKVVDQASDNVEAHTLLGTLQLTMSQLRCAKKSFATVLESIDKFDLVSLLQIGNITLFSATKETKEKVLLEAWRLFDKVLVLDPRNPYAANGIAIALREKGCLEEALRLFEQVRETDDKVPCFMVNYAHILSELGQFKRAIPLYEKALLRFYEGKNVDLLVSTARAYYYLGKTTKSADHLQAALKYIQLALHIFPKDKTLWFNLAIVLQDHTVVLSVERLDKISVSKMREAVKLADLAIRNLTWLANMPSDQYDQHIASQRISYTRMVKEKLEKRIDELIETQTDRQKRLTEMIQQKQHEEAELKRLAKLEEEKKKMEMEMVLKTYESMNEKIREELKVWDSLQSKTQKQLSSSRTRDEDGFVIPASDSDLDMDEAGEGKQTSSSRKSKKKLKRPPPSSSSSSEFTSSPTVAHEPLPSNLNDFDVMTAQPLGKANESTEEPSTKRRRLKKKGGASYSQPISSEFIIDSDAELAEDVDKN